MRLYKECSGAGTSLLMIHGIMSDHTFFSEVIPYLADTYEVLTYDRAGYGQSKLIKERYSMKEQAEDAAKMIEESCTKPVYVLGYSVGGLIALEVAKRYPSLVKGIVLLETPVGCDHLKKEKLVKWYEELRKYIRDKNILKAIVSLCKMMESKGGNVKASKTDLKAIYHNAANFMYGEFEDISEYVPQIYDLKHIEVPIIMGITIANKESIFTSLSKRDAEILEWPIEIFEGSHNAVKEKPQEFAQTLKNILNYMEER